MSSDKAKAAIYMSTAAGRKFFPFDPTPDQVNIKTVAHHLACQGRWNGATQHRTYSNRIFYSVAEHSVYVARYIQFELGRPDLALEALLHDAPEAYVGDMIRPLKYADEFREPFKAIEDRVEEAVCKAFGLQHPLPDEVKIADDAVCAAEWEQIVPHDHDEPLSIINAGIKPAKVNIHMMEPFQARNFFLNEYFALTRTWQKVV